MVVEHVMFYLSLFVFMMMFTLGTSAMQPNASPRLQTLGNLLFPNFRRTVIVLFVSQLGIVIDIVSQVLPLFSTEVSYVSLLGLLLVFSTLLFGAVSSVAMAKHIERKRRKKPIDGSQLDLATILETPCFRQLSMHISEFEHSRSPVENLRSLLTFLEREDFLERLVRHIYDTGLEENCVDEILWSAFFDRFESIQPSQEAGVSWSARGELRRYRAAKARLLRLDNELSRLFVESLERWQTARGG